MEGILAIIFIFGGGTMFLLATSPIGKAIAERIRNSGPGPAMDPQLLAEVEGRLLEIHEQLPGGQG